MYKILIASVLGIVVQLTPTVGSYSAEGQGCFLAFHQYWGTGPSNNKGVVNILIKKTFLDINGFKLSLFAECFASCTRNKYLLLSSDGRDLQGFFFLHLFIDKYPPSPTLFFLYKNPKIS